MLCKKITIYNTSAVQELKEIYGHIFSRSPQNAQIIRFEIENSIISNTIMLFKKPKELILIGENICFSTKLKVRTIYVLAILITSRYFMKITDEDSWTIICESSTRQFVLSFPK